MEGFDRATQDRTEPLRFARTSSKGELRDAAIQVADMLERHCRRMHLVTGGVFTLDPPTLAVPDTGELYRDFHAALDALPVSVEEVGELVRQLDPR